MTTQIDAPTALAALADIRLAEADDDITVTAALMAIGIIFREAEDIDDGPRVDEIEPVAKWLAHSTPRPPAPSGAERVPVVIRSGALAIEQHARFLPAETIARAVATMRELADRIEKALGPTMQ